MKSLIHFSVVISVVISAVLTLLAGCASDPVYLDLRQANEPQTNSPRVGERTTLGLDYRDFEFAAEQAVASFLESPLSVKPDNNVYVMAVSRIVNDTALDIDTDQLIKKIRIDLLESGRVIATTAVGLGDPEDPLSAKIRELRKNKLFDQSTVASEGTMVAPDMGLSGKIIQRTNRVGDKQQVDYYFQLSATDIGTGLAFWEFEQVIVKLGSNQRFSWQ